MSGWRGPIVTDSGGFQAYSLIRQDPRRGSIHDKGLTFKPVNGAKKIQLTPEKSVEIQIRLGADMVVCLDDCTHEAEAEEAQENSVRRTVEWARRGKSTFEDSLARRNVAPKDRPQLFAVIQGGSSPDLRRRCTESLLEIGFDGFGYGGWPLDREGRFMESVFALVRELVPPSFPLFALGVGHPDTVVRCRELGYQLFDSSMPTKDARHGRLYLPAPESPPPGGRRRPERVSYLYMGDEKHRRDPRPLSKACTCTACSSVSRAYLHHLYRLRDPLYARLSSIHNLHFMTELLDEPEGDRDE
jgi:queuine tRNA-ribosyltransferase